MVISPIHVDVSDCRIKLNRYDKVANNTVYENYQQLLATTPAHQQNDFWFRNQLANLEMAMVDRDMVYAPGDDSTSRNFIWQKDLATMPARLYLAAIQSHKMRHVKTKAAA